MNQEKLEVHLSYSFSMLKKSEPEKTEAMTKKLLGEINHQISNGLRLSSILEHIYKALDWVYEAERGIDSFPLSTAQCQVGCSGCCGVEVHLGRVEADLIYSKHKDKIEKNLDKLKRLSKYTNIERMKLPFDDRACAFLEDNKCSIYNERPLACRRYFVRSDPKLCRGLGDPIVEVVFSSFGETLGAAWTISCAQLFSVDDNDTLEKHLLRIVRRGDRK